MTEPIRIEGLKEFSRKLRAMDKSLPKGLRIALNEAGDKVVKATVPKIPHVTGRAAASLKAKSTTKTSRVAGGARKAPWYPWLDFGGRVGRHNSTSRPFLKKGRYLWKTYGEMSASGEFEKVLRKALIGVATGAGIEVQTHGN
jgi:hypothetical protein